MARVRVAVVSRIPGLLDALRAHAAFEPAAVELHVIAPDGARDAALAAAEIVLADPPAISPLLDGCASLQWIHSTFAGTGREEARAP